MKKEYIYIILIMVAILAVIVFGWYMVVCHPVITSIITAIGLLDGPLVLEKDAKL